MVKEYYDITLTYMYVLERIIIQIMDVRMSDEHNKIANGKSRCKLVHVLCVLV